MKLFVPNNKDVAFAKELFETLSNELIDLKVESGKWPDSISFTGPLGKEILEFIERAEWDFKSFGPKFAPGPVNKIRIEYSKPLEQISGQERTIFDQSFNERQINGIPGPETVAKIVGEYSRPAFTIQRTIRPTREITLKRR